ncbi:MAG: zinc ABC transporter substrate-binding protein [Deltaproteobacteria bacterium]|nr:zinc ABC transporter substrate-binding protein [Deltaproteobacteria bacterium]MBW2170488.1 zinc ABC transporter substrate-binding protein [Deltaproteobacteria bacterium]
MALLKAALVCSEPLDDANERIRVFVSILPQAYFVERVGGGRVDVSVMVGPGHSPATYEPMPKQMAELSRAKLYFRIGVPFENVWMERISKANPDMKVVDTRKGIGLMSMKGHNHAGFQAERQNGGLKDPHIWLSLRLTRTVAQNIYEALVSEDPLHQSSYQDNLRAFHYDLDDLDAEIAEIVKNDATRKFMVFHPAWGYFAQDYALEQIPIETEGKEATAKGLARVIKEGRKEGIKVIFVQKQFSEKSAATVANAIGGRVIQIDPLARDYLNNMKKIAQIFAEVLQ